MNLLPHHFHLVVANIEEKTKHESSAAQKSQDHLLGFLPLGPRCNKTSKWWIMLLNNRPSNHTNE